MDKNLKDCLAHLEYLKQTNSQNNNETKEDNKAVKIVKINDNELQEVVQKTYILEDGRQLLI